MKRLLMMGIAAALAAACGTERAGPDGTAGSVAQGSGAAMIVIHTGTTVQALTATTANRERTRVEDFYPLVCLDSDDDSDGIPDSMDPVPPADGGSVSGSHGCQRCNRGPGTNGDFRLDLQGAAVELDRGRVSGVANGVLTVIGPNGNLFFDLPSGARVDDGPVTPGAEVRIEGSVISANHYTVTRLKVLCPGPGSVPDEEVPPGSGSIPLDPDSAQDGDDAGSGGAPVN